MIENIYTLHFKLYTGSNKNYPKKSSNYNLVTRN
jgi:hypothetical protein